MDSLEAEYSFLAPTWRLPTVATTSMYSPRYGASYQPNALDSVPDPALWNNTMYNSRYIPSYGLSTATHRNYHILPNQQRIIPAQQQTYQPPGGRLTQSGPVYYQQSNYPNSDDDPQLTTNTYSNNEHESYNNTSNYGQSHQQPANRGLTYATNGQQNPHPPPPPNQKRRVQIIDHNRQTPSTVANEYASDKQSHHSTNAHAVSHQNHTSELNRTQQKSKRSVSNQQRNHPEESLHGYVGNNYNIHEYLYGLSAPDPGSYRSAFKQQQRRLQDEKLARKSVMSDYKAFVQNGGFGPTFGNSEYQRYGEKIDSEKKKKTYSKSVRETNQHRIEEQKRTNNNDHQKHHPAPVPKYQRCDAIKSRFSPVQEAREYADKIEKPQHLKPMSQTELSTISPILITSLSNNRRRSSLDSIHSVNLSDLVSGEFHSNRSRRSSSLSSIKIPRRVRFHSRDFIRRRSSTIIDLPSYIVGKGIPHRQDSLSAHCHTEKSASKILDEKERTNIEHLQNFSFPSTLNENEKKSIISHSMITTKNMRLPPTATVVINQTYKPSLMATTSTNSQLKKTFFNKEILPSQRPLTARSIPAPYRKSTSISEPEFDLNIKSFHQHHDSSNE